MPKKKHGEIILEFSDNFMNHRLQNGQIVLPGSSLLLRTLIFNGKMPNNRNEDGQIFEEIFLLKPLLLLLSERNGQTRKYEINLKQKIEPNNRGFHINVFEAGRNKGPMLLVANKIGPFKSKESTIWHIPKPPFPKKICHNEFYEFMHRIGYRYGPSFRSIEHLEYGTGFEESRFCAWGKCNLKPNLGELDIQLDGLWQAMAFCIIKEADSGKLPQQCLVPFSIGRLEIGKKLTSMTSIEGVKMYFMVHLEGQALGNCWISMPKRNELLLLIKDLLFRPMPEMTISKQIGNGPEDGQKKVIIRSMAYQLPDGINSPKQFWALLCQIGTTDQRIPANRIDERNLLIKGTFNGGNIPVEGGHFLSRDLAAFDANFFGLSAMEAATIDPQHRILMECVWECLDKTGCTNSPKSMTQCGFFIGFMGSEYAELADNQENALQMLGAAASTVSGRLAHFFDSRGPAISIDTACSSSLVAMQLAVDAIQKGRCPRAVVGGVNLTFTAKGLVQRANGGMLSEDGRCRAFDASATGYGRADGCVAMLLEGIETVEELEQIPHLAVIEAIETGHDGRSAAMTAPNGLAQQELIERCLAQIEDEKKRRLRFWECHGTGTALGDPVEFLALARALSQTKMSSQLFAGTAKANIGHTEAVSGLVGTIKAILQLHHGFVPPLAHFQKLNPQIQSGMLAEFNEEEANWPIKIAVKGENLMEMINRLLYEAESKPFPKVTLLGGISSFGVAGTLACAILSANHSIHFAQSTAIRRQIQENCSWGWQRILPICAKSNWSMEKLIEIYLREIEAGNWPIQEICASSAHLNANHHWPFRAVLIFGEENGRMEIIKKSHFSGIRFRFGFWPNFQSSFHREVPTYRHEFRTFLHKIEVNEEELIGPNCGHRNLLKLADSFARFRMLIKFGLILEEEEEIVEEIGSLDMLREFIWQEDNLNKTTIEKCLIEMEGGIEEGKTIPKSSKMKTASATVDVQHFSLIIGPFVGQFTFATLNSPSDLCLLFGHAHCLGIPLKWTEIFQIEQPSLLQLLPRPNYPFDLSKRFWSGKDAWTNFDHPLLGNRMQQLKMDGIERFEGLACARRFTWLGELYLNGRPILLGIGPLLEMLAVVGKTHFQKCPTCISIQIRQFDSIELPLDGRQWLWTEIYPSKGNKKLAQIEIWAIGMDEGENGRRKLCTAEIQINSKFQQKQTKLLANPTNEIDLNYSCHFDEIGINYGPKWRMEFIKLAKNKWKIWPSNRLGNGIMQFLFNPILLETTIMQILLKFYQLESYGKFVENLEWVEMHFDEKCKNDEEIGRLDEYEMEWNAQNKEANIFRPDGNLLVRAKFKENGRENGQGNRLGQNKWNEKEQKKGEGFGQMEKEELKKDFPLNVSPNSLANSPLVHSMHSLLCSTIPSGQLSPNWLHSSLTQLGLDSLALMALAQQLNKEFGLGKEGRRAISTGEVFMAKKVEDLVELVEKRKQGMEEVEEKYGKGKNEEEWNLKKLEGKLNRNNSTKMDLSIAAKNDGNDNGIEFEEGIPSRINMKEGNEEDDQKEAMNCIFEFVELREEKETSNWMKSTNYSIMGPEDIFTFVQIDETNNKMEFAIQKKENGLEKRMKFNLNEFEEEFEENVKTFCGQIFDTTNWEDNGEEQKITSILLQFNFNNADQFHESILLSNFANALLLFARSILQHLHYNSTKKIQLRIGHLTNSLHRAFAKSFLQNLQTENGQIELANDEREFYFKRVQCKEMEEVDWDKPKGTWLITGGTGGIGLEMAQWLVHNFAPQLDCLLLLARNRPKSPHFWQTLEEMRRLDQCHVELILADVTNITQMEQLFQRQEMHRLNGLIHSAGFLLNAPMAAMDPRAMANILEAKAGSALLLTFLLDKFKLKPSYLIINSSFASLHPSPGQSIYAATNALCDTLIQRRRAEGRVGTTLNWANWLQVGMAANRPGINEQLRWIGLDGLRTSVALHCFEMALRIKPIQWICGKFNFERLRQQRPTLWRRFMQNGELKEKNVIHIFGQRIRQNVKNECSSLIQRVLTKLVGNEFIDSNQGFMELGLDSFGLYQFAHMLNAELSQNGFDKLGISVLDLFERGNVEKLAEFLHEKMENKTVKSAELEEDGLSRKCWETNKKIDESEEKGIEKNKSKSEENIEAKCCETRTNCGQSFMGIAAKFEANNVELTISNNFPLNSLKLETEWPKISALNHHLNGRPLVPAAIQIHRFFEQILAKSQPKSNKIVIDISNIEFMKKLWLNEWTETKLIESKNEGNEWMMALVIDESGGKQQQLSRCNIQQKQQEGENDAPEECQMNIRIEDWQKTFKENFYSTLHSLGMEYGPGMQIVRRAFVHPTNAGSNILVHAEMAELPQKMTNQFLLPPIWALIEFCLQTLAIGLFHADNWAFYMPISIQNIRWHSQFANPKMKETTPIFALGNAIPGKEGQFAKGNVKIFDSYGSSSTQKILLQIDGILARRMEPSKEFGQLSELTNNNNENENGKMEKNWLRWIRPEKDLAILAASGTFSSCRNINEFWAALMQSGQCFSTTCPDVAQPKSLVPVSGICPHIEHFDTALFASAGLSLGEWRRLDPQIRLLAEHSYSALEQSGYGRKEKRERMRIGCFVGAEPSSSEYSEADEREAARGSLLGMHRRNQQSFAAQWISHLLDLHGPSVGVYSACSSSFSALAQASQALLCNDADLCLVAAVHLIHPSQIGHLAIEGQPLAKCATQSWPFYSKSQGILRGSGCVVLVLERADVAIRRANPILAILKSIALSNDGNNSKSSFMAPSVSGQRAAIQLALNRSEIDAKEKLAFWECHAAGTALGDAIELDALYRAFFGTSEGSQQRKRPLHIGSSKANFGHCFAASGLCSIVKLMKMLSTGLVPPQLLPSGLQNQQPDLLSPFEGHFIVHSGPGLVQLGKLTGVNDGRPIFVGASSFGIGGTNGAVVLMEGPSREQIVRKMMEEVENGNISPLIDSTACHWQIFPISAASRQSVKNFAKKLAEYIQHEIPEKGGGQFARIANTLQCRRQLHRFRAVVLASNWQELVDGLGRIASSSNDDDRIVELDGLKPQEFGIFFGPQGVQFPGMFLMERQYSPFLDAQIRHLCGQLDLEFVGRPNGLLQSLDSPLASISPSHAQPALFAIAHSILAFLADSIDIFAQNQAAILFGHSLGEFSAICAAGAFTKEAGMRLLGRRAELIENGTLPAKMILLRHLPGEMPPSIHGLDLSARLSPNLSVYIGLPENVNQAIQQIRFLHPNVNCRILNRLNRGFHSPKLMGPILGEFSQIAEKILGWSDEFNGAKVLSNLDGKQMKIERRGVPEYLCRQISQTVQLDLCLESLLHNFPYVRLLIEIGPPSILGELLRDTANSMGIDCAKVEVISTMRRNQNAEEPPQLLAAIGRLWQLGFPINFDRIFGHPSWDWDSQMPSYQFHRIALNPNGYEHLIPFCNENEQMMIEIREKMEEKDRNDGAKWKQKEKPKELEEIVTQVWADWLPLGDKTRINADFDFFEMGGGNSLQAAQIVWRLEKRLAMEEGALSLEMLFRHPKFGDFVEAIWLLKTSNGGHKNGKGNNQNQQNGIERMANFEFKENFKGFNKQIERQKLSKNMKNFGQNDYSNIQESDEGMATKWIDQNHPNSPQMLLSPSNSLLLPLFLQLKPSSSNGPIRLHIFCIHPIAGSAFIYCHLAQAFPEWANVVGIQFAQGLPEIDSAASLNELAKIYAKKIIGQKIVAPILLIGHSLGGVLAYEIGIHLNGMFSPHNHPLVIMLDSWAIGQKEICLQKAGQFVAEQFSQFSPNQRSKLALGAQKLTAFFRDHRFIPSKKGIFAEVWLFRATRRSKLPFSDFVDHTRDGGWAKLIDRFNLVECDADHEGIMAPECVQQNQQIFSEICEQAAASMPILII